MKEPKVHVGILFEPQIYPAESVPHQRYGNQW